MDLDRIANFLLYLVDVGAIHGNPPSYSCVLFYYSLFVGEINPKSPSSSATSPRCGPFVHALRCPLPFFLFVQGAGAALDDAVVVQHGDDGSKEALHVHAEAQMLHIVAVELGLLVDLQLIAAVDLRPAGSRKLLP